MIHFIRHVAIATALVLGLSACASETSFTPAMNTTNARNQAKHPVAVYGATSCFESTLLTAFLRSHGIPYHYYSVTGSPEGMRYYALQGGPGVPIVVIGKTRIVGYNKGPIITALQQNGYQL